MHHKDDCDDGERHPKCRQVCRRKATADFHELIEGTIGGDCDAEHFAKHRNSDLKPNPREKSDQHRLRKEVGKKPKVEYPRPGATSRRQAAQRLRQGRRSVRFLSSPSATGRRLGSPQSRNRLQLPGSETSRALRMRLEAKAVSRAR